MTREISNTDSILDSRDIIARIEELEEERAALAEALEEAESEMVDAVEENNGEDADEDTAESVKDTTKAADEAAKALAEWDANTEAEELAILKAFADEAEGYADDWKHGATLIRESYFTEYCQEMVQDIGDLPKDIPSYIEIDWKATARNLRMDYTEAEFDGVTYLVR